MSEEKQENVAIADHIELSENAKICCTGYIGGECEIIEIDTKTQTFNIQMYLQILWKDSIKYQDINETNAENIETLKAKLSGKSGAETNSNPQNRYPGYFIKINSVEKKLIKNKIPLFGSLSYIFRNTSQIESVNAKKEISRILYRPQDELFIQYLHFKGIFHEDFEFSSFPFDKQFLNIKINYNHEDFEFMNDFYAIERDKTLDDGFAVKRMQEQQFRVRLGESVTEYNLKTPWLDLKHDHDEFCVLKLRVTRKSYFYICSNLMPLFIIILCTFGCVVMYEDEISIDVKLTYVAAFLLTITALQFSVTQDLPNKSELSIMDLYFVVAYCILGLMILILIIDYFLDDVKIGIILQLLLLLIWILVSLFVFCHKNENPSDEQWNETANQESETWNQQKVYKYGINRPQQN